MTDDLLSKRCLACESGVPPLTQDKMQNLLAKTPEWQVSADQTFISRRFSFKNFYHTMAFVNAIAWVANKENHHPDMEVGFNYCSVKYTTHAINGLTENDFICAAKIDALVGAV